MKFADLPLGGIFQDDGTIWEKVEAGRAKPLGSAGPSYSINGITDVQPMLRLHGRAFAIVAEFRFTPDGVDAANAYMDENPTASVISVKDGRVILASNEDFGIPL